MRCAATPRRAAVAQLIVRLPAQLLEANALDVLNKLQNHADATIAADATFVFQKSVVLIYDIG